MFLVWGLQPVSVQVWPEDQQYQYHMGTCKLQWFRPPCVPSAVALSWASHPIQNPLSYAPPSVLHILWRIGLLKSLGDACRNAVSRSSSPVESQSLTVGPQDLLLSQHCLV